VPTARLCCPKTMGSSFHLATTIGCKDVVVFVFHTTILDLGSPSSIDPEGDAPSIFLDRFAK